MSWDIFVQDLPPQARSVRDIPENFVPSLLLSRTELIQRIRKFVPTANFSDEAWGTFEAEAFSVEFNLGGEEMLDSFALHVRGGDQAAAFVSDLLAYLGYRALDGQSASGFFEPGKVAEASLNRWRAYRNQIVKDTA